MASSPFNQRMLALLASTGAIHTVEPEHLPVIIARLKALDLRNWPAHVRDERSAELVSSTIEALVRVADSPDADDVLAIIERVAVEIHRLLAIPEDKQYHTDRFYQIGMGEMAAMELSIWWAATYYEADAINAWSQALPTLAARFRPWLEQDRFGNVQQYGVRYMEPALLLARLAYRPYKDESGEGLFDAFVAATEAHREAEFGTRQYDMRPERDGKDHDYAYNAAKPRIYSASEIVERAMERDELEAAAERPDLPDDLAPPAGKADEDDRPTLNQI